MKQSNRNTVAREFCSIEPMESRQLLAAHFGLDAALAGFAETAPRLAAHAQEAGAHDYSIQAHAYSPANQDSWQEPRLVLDSASGDAAVFFPQPGGAVVISIRSGEVTFFNSPVHQPTDVPPDSSNFNAGDYGWARFNRGYRGPSPRSTNPSHQNPRGDNSESDSSSDASPRSVAYDSAGNANASTTVNAAAGATRAVARSIFSNEAVAADSETTNPSVRATPASATASSATTVFQSLFAGRSAMVYASVLPQELAPAAAEARGVVAAVRVMADAPAAAADLAVSAAVHALPAPRQIFQFARIGSPFMLLADSVGEFIQESASMTGMITQPSAAQHPRAWTVTFTVIAADVAMLSYYFHTRRKARLAQAMQPVGAA
jgi:hypothetical protein